MHCETSRKIIDSSNNAAGQAWKDQYVRSLVSVAGVWGGTARAVKVFAVGDNLDSWFLNEKNLLWERTNPSLAWLMPSADFWTDDEVSFITTIFRCDKHLYSRLCHSVTSHHAISDIERV